MGVSTTCQISLLFLILIFVFFYSNQNVEAASNLPREPFTEEFLKLLQDQIMLAEQKRDEILDRQLTGLSNPYHDEIVEFELNQPPFQNSDVTKVLKTGNEILRLHIEEQAILAENSKKFILIFFIRKIYKQSSPSYDMAAKDHAWWKDLPEELEQDIESFS